MLRYCVACVVDAFAFVVTFATLVDGDADDCDGAYAFDDVAQIYHYFVYSI